MAAVSSVPARPAARSRRRPSSVSAVSWGLLRWGTIALALLAVLVPFFWLVSTSFKREVDYLADPPRFLVENWTLAGYETLFSRNDLGHFFLNSVVVTLASTALAVTLGSLAAYTLARARLPFKLNGALAFWMLLTRMYPAIATAIPYFLIIRDLQLLDTRWALIVTYTAFNLPFVVWLMIGFFEEVPAELERAAMIDGCGAWQRFTRIVLPISGPALVATAILSAILAWNEFLFAVMLTRTEAKTLPVVMAGFITDKGMLWDQMTALGVVTVLPVLLFALAVQRYLVRGLTLGAVKE
ncbi:MAG: ABC transporter, permease protein 2 (cluster 1, maltose/g3p/polyamine/iron) [uncultured Thermomicrobiales bacterium]|uniref:ABC transporter, permease protein 2 (Cluster 1, maltose/g3p/polyamine/iron) n=1 Tax=uncultured Thermomicrobiales bacterium TaxID=1645740 RepID=A0A6J4V9T0_9BACT|nr:MAG: ABC transporter, permease protein 2 (cluster 1, maltose/g3p/polyamine/iron) [uncultured Thermomicrobiales bacterium]